MRRHEDIRFGGVRQWEKTPWRPSPTRSFWFYDEGCLRFVSQTLVALDAKRNRADLEALAAMIDAGTIRPMVERTVPLSAVPDAIRYLETGHARGKVVITLAGVL